MLTVHTEDEARERACPMRLSHPGVSALSQKCLASACMAWRWAGAPAMSTVHEDGSVTPDAPPGFCGMALPADIGNRLKE